MDKGAIKSNDRLLIENATVAVCFLSVISQLPIIFNNPLLKPIGTVPWLILLALLLIKRPSITIHPIISLPIIFDVWIVVCEATNKFNGNYIGSAIFTAVNMCTFILVIGFMLSHYYCKAFFMKIAKAYIYATDVLCIYIYFKYFFGRSIRSGYLYNTKNSAASIVLCAFILLCFLGKKTMPKKSKVLWIINIVFLGFILFYMKSRTVLIGAVGALLWYLIFVEKRIPVKVAIISVCVFFALFIAFNDSAYDLFVNKWWFNGKAHDDFNAITSNRQAHFEEFKILFPQSPFWGRGGTYLESFPLAALASYGIPGAALLFIFMLFPIFIGFKTLGNNIKSRTSKRLALIIIAISITILINCIAEELPPFGPGVKCFLMWFLAGFAVNAHKISLLKENQLD